MNENINPFKLLTLSVCGGICISLGCMVFLASNERIIGSVLFSVGLLSIVVHKFKLYTGVISYALNSIEEFEDTFIVLFGNIVGVCIAGLIYNICLIETPVNQIVEAKIAAPWFVIFGKAMLCNILIYLAVDEWKNSKNSILLILAVSTFVYCGFEHCIANLFYMVAAYKVDAAFFAFNIFGNAAGGMLLHNIKAHSPK